MRGRLALWVFILSLIALVSFSQDHRIGIRKVHNRAEFFDRATGERFTPLGNNYVRLASQEKADGEEILYHSTFNPGLYDTSAVAEALGKMRHDRYNVVRVFLNHLPEGGIGGAGNRLSWQYMNNVVDFLQRARANDIYVMFTIDWIPIPKRGTAIKHLWCPDFQCTNVHVLAREGLRANQTFFKQFIRGLKARAAPLETVLAYELRNELTFDPHLPPLSLQHGTVKTANGRTYDLSRPNEKERMVNEGLVYWIDQVRAAIRSIDPGSLVTVGFVPPKDAKTSLRMQKLSVTGPAFRKSKMDFIDVHIYPFADGVSLQEFVDHFGLAGVADKPVIMGELGALRQYYPSAEAAARDLRKWQTSSEMYGFSGWIIWAWDTHELPEVFNSQDDNGVVNRSLAPRYRLDPGESAFPKPGEGNVAFGKPVAVSRSSGEHPPSNAVDGTILPWNAGDFAPQWIEVDLLQPTTISMIRLMVSQTPAGETSHEIWVRGPSEEYRMLREIRENTGNGRVLVFPTPGLSDIQFVKVTTLQSPSWVGWAEIEVINGS